MSKESSRNRGFGRKISYCENVHKVILIFHMIFAAAYFIMIVGVLITFIRRVCSIKFF